MRTFIFENKFRKRREIMKNASSVDHGRHIGVLITNN